MKCLMRLVRCEPGVMSEGGFLIPQEPRLNAPGLVIGPWFTRTCGSEVRDLTEDCGGTYTLVSARTFHARGNL